MNVSYPGLLSHDLQAAFNRQVTGKLQQWAKDWLSDATSLKIDKAEFATALFNTQGTTVNENNLVAGNAEFAVLYSGEETIPPGALALGVDSFTDADKPLVQSITQKMQSQLRERFAEADDNKLPTGVFEYACRVAFNIGNCGLEVLFAPGYLHRFLKARLDQDKTPLKGLSIKQMVCEQRVSLSLNMQSQPITIGQLMSLKVGHVIPLGQAIQEPLTLAGADDTTQLLGFLVKQAEQKAVYITGVAK